MAELINDPLLLTEVESLVLDQFQVVSYKWLSRKFSLSSNTAKRLLQEAANQKVQGIEAVYVVSGWKKGEPSCYFVQLVPSAKLEATKAGLAGSPSIHVYSLQPSIPKDPAQLWSADFVQAEELFNQPPDVNNCLRDNRFSAVSCSLVTRNLKGKLLRVTPPDPATESHPSFATHQVTSAGPSGSAPAAAAPKISKPVSSESKDASMPPKNLNVSEIPGKMLPATVTAGKRTTGGPHVQGPSGQGGALKSLWGRASGKPPKSLKVSPHSAQKHVPASGAASDADACIRALESGEELDSDDDVANFSRLRRGRTRNDIGRKRRVIFDDEKSDSQEEEHTVLDSEDVVSLASPELPKERPVAAVESDMKTINSRLRVKTEKSSDTKGKTGSVNTDIKDYRPSTSTHLQECAPAELKDQRVSSNNAQHDIASPLNSKPMEVLGPQTSEKLSVGKVDHGGDLAPVASGTITDANSGSKKRKVLITRIDDRGREVTEVVWETHQKEGSNGAADHAAPPPEVKPQVDRSVAPLNTKTAAVLRRPATNKTGSKAIGKAAGKALQKGSLLSFFKKKD
ncbi:hypothetical protein O6H91_14G056900 [Diphasiastrum complanatum]|uniref:Uncharacterized protein n=1 Tax=Diphasiastrum complanatum TaxID=34168 RepID=A0ACC2BPR1_DIPCM|nr:hypothetical protein O6H91_14G056900 [Diphasiastrum complanatum]